MKKYEGMFLIEPETASKKQDEVTAHIRDTVQKHQGEVLDLDKWDERRLAYEIKRQRKGTYLLGHFRIPPEKVNDIRDEFLISDTVLRHMFIEDTGRMQFFGDEAAEGAAKTVRKERETVKSAQEKTAPQESTPREEQAPGAAEETVPQESTPREEQAPGAAEDTTPKTAATEETETKGETEQTLKEEKTGEPPTAE